jgi:hypothetical protein
MKTKLLFFLFILIISKTYSQSLETLKIETVKMYDASYTMDFETILDLTYPKVFDIVNRESMLSSLDNLFQNKTMKVRFVHPTVTFTYADIKEIEGKKFCVINYKNAMRITFDEKLTQEKVAIFLKSMNETEKYTTVKFETERNSFLLEGNSILIAVSDERSKNRWTFLNHDSDDFFVQIFNANIKKELGL